MTSPENAPWVQAALVARRHHVGMAGKGDVRRRVADAGIEIVDVGGAGFAEGDAMHLEAGGLQECFPARRARRHRPALPMGSGRDRGQWRGHHSWPPLNMRSRRWASAVRHEFQLAVLVPARAGLDRAPAGRARTGWARGRPLRQQHLDEAPDIRRREHGGQKPTSGSGRSQSRACRSRPEAATTKRNDPPAAPVAIVQPLDRGRSRPDHTTTTGGADRRRTSGDGWLDAGARRVDAGRCGIGIERELTNVPEDESMADRPTPNRSAIAQHTIMTSTG